VEAEVIEEGLITLYVNGAELATIISTSCDQVDQALGFLANERFIDSAEEVDHAYLTSDGCCADVWLTHAVEIPERRIITSGRGGGLTFQDMLGEAEPIEDGRQVAPQRLYELLNQLQQPGSQYARARGVHASGLSDGETLLALREDVGRHNTIDKLRGACLRDGMRPGAESCSPQDACRLRCSTRRR
jgi:FdhD protein